MAKKDKYSLRDKAAEIVLCCGEKVLDLGCGDGALSNILKEKGFDVTASDKDGDRFNFWDEIPFCKCDLENPLPFKSGEFDCVVFLEVIEHLRNPFFAIKEISRILKPGGVLVLSTPNILNIRSRLRFLFEGSFDFFREPSVDFYKHNPPSEHFRIHAISWRYQELEYMLFDNGLSVESVSTDQRLGQFAPLYFLLYPILNIHNELKRSRALKKGGFDYGRINDILMSKDLMLGKHLIVTATKQ